MKKVALVIDNSSGMLQEDIEKLNPQKIIPISFMVNGEEYYENELEIINSRINFENELKFKKIIDNIHNEKNNYDNQINNRKDKLFETISSYQKTIILFEKIISNKLKENKILKENYHNSSSEKKEQRNKYKNNISYIKDLKKQIKVNNKNIKELGETNFKIEKDITKHNKNYNKQLKSITKTLQNEASVYTNNIDLIRGQYYKLKSLINKSGYYTSRRKYTYENSTKYTNKIMTMNSKFLNHVKNYFEIHYLKFDNSISKEHNILQQSYDKNYLHHKKIIDNAINDEFNIYNTKVKSISNSNTAILEGFLKNHITNKKDLISQIEENSKASLEKIAAHDTEINKLLKDRDYELKCHNANHTSYEADYKKSLKDLTLSYSLLVEQITKDYHDKIFKLETDKKIHDKNIQNQQISLETIRKNTINDLNNEFETAVNKTKNKINLIKETDKEAKIKLEKQKKLSLKKFVNEQLEIRLDYNQQEQEIDAKCELRISNNKKNFIKKFKTQK